VGPHAIKVCDGDSENQLGKCLAVQLVKVSSTGRISD
jgi:hypothetical protein